MIRVAFLVSLVACGLHGPAWAQNLRGLPMGTRSACIGQAGVGGSPDDGSAYLNPAALSSLDGDRLSLSTTLITASVLRPDEALASNDKVHETSRGVELSSSAFLPTSFSYMVAWGKRARYATGLSLFVPVYEVFSFKGKSTFENNVNSADSYYVRDEHAEIRFKRLLLGPSFAIGIPRIRLRLGASLLASITQLSKNGASWETGVIRDRGLSSLYLEEVDMAMLVFGGTGVLGVQWDPIPALTLGVSFKTGLFTVGATSRYKWMHREVDSEMSRSNLMEGSFDSPTVPDPPELRAGVALRIRTVEVRADVLYTLSSDTDIGVLNLMLNHMASNTPPGFELDNSPTRMPMKGALNVSAGAILTLSPRWSASLGFLTDRSSSRTPGPEEENTILWPRQDRYLGTVGGSYQSGAFSIHGGFAAGGVRYANRDFGGASEGERTGFVLRAFLAGGISAHDVRRAF